MDHEQILIILTEIRSFDPLPEIATRYQIPDTCTKVKSCDLSIMHDNSVMPTRKMSSDWLKTYVTEQGFR